MALLENSTYSLMFSYIWKSDINKVFFLEDFVHCGSYTSIRSEIVRLTQDNVLCRVARGIYLKADCLTLYSKEELASLVINSFIEHYDLKARPLGNYLLYKIGALKKLPQQINLSYDSKHPRYINILNHYKIAFKPCSNSWMNQISSENLVLLLACITGRWKNTYIISKNDAILMASKNIDINLLKSYNEIIPHGIYKKCLKFLINNSL